MKIIHLIVSVILFLVFPLVAGGEHKPDIKAHPEVKGALSIMDAWIDGVRDYQKVPGISIGFVVDQDLIYANGYGYANLQKKLPADLDTIYSICSISKLFTSIGVMQMRDAGKLSLRDPVAEHLNWFDIKQKHEEAGPARILGLLTHSSGLPRESDFEYWGGDGFPFPSRDQMIEKLEQQQTLYPADTYFQYSNLALTLAGEILQKAAGLPYMDYVEQDILSPIGLRDTKPYFPRKLHGKQMAVGYTGRSRGGERSEVQPFYTKGITPAAGFTSTVKDLGTFASWNFRTITGKDSSVLSPNTLREMHRVHWVESDWKTTWGIGFNVRKAEGQTIGGHGGACPGYITSLAMVPRYKIAAIALTNAADGPAASITTELLKVVGSALQKAIKAPESSDQLPDFSRYEGNYGGNVWGGESAVRQWGDQLAVIRLPSRSVDVGRLKYVEGDTFVRLTREGEERERWVFVTNKKDEVEEESINH